MRRFLKYILIMISAVMLFLALAGGYIAYYVSNNRSSLKNLLVKQVNELTVGKWSVDSISINMWESYPFVVVNLHNLKLYKDTTAINAHDPILAVNNAWFRAGIFSLMQKRLSVTNIGFTEIKANLKKEDDKDLNLIEALKLNKDVDIPDQMLSFNIEKIDISQMSINFSATKFSTEKPILIDRFLAKIKREESTINLLDCSLECYGLKFFLDLNYDYTSHHVAVDFSSSSRLLKFRGDLNFSKTSIVTVKSNIESSVPLAEYSNGKMSGELFAKGVVDFDFDLITYRVINDRCKLKFGLNDVLYNHSFDYAPSVVLQSGIIEYSSSSIVGNQIIVGVGTNKLEVNFISNSIIDIINRRNNYDVGLSINVKSSDFNPYIIKERLGLTVDSLSKENSIKEMSVRLHTNISPENNPASFKGANGNFKAVIDNYSAQLSDSAKVSNFGGDFEIAGSTIYLRNFKGLINDSQTSFNSQIDVKRRADSEVFESVDIDVDLTTSHFSPHEIVKMPIKIVLNDIKSNFSVEIKPDINRHAEELDNFNMKFKSFSALIDGKRVSQQSIVEKRKDRLEIISSKIEYNNDIFDLNGTINLAGENRIDTLNIKSNNFDFKQLVSDKSTGYTEMPKVNVPLVINLNVGRFILLDQNLLNLKGAICIEKNQSLLFKDVSCSVAGGNISFNGELIQEAKNLEIKSKVKYSDIDFKDLNVKYKISKNDKDRYVNENLRGRISGTLDANLFIDKDINVDVMRSTVNADFVIVNGQLVDFAPIKAASKYFQRSNLNDIRFDTLTNKVAIKSGVITLPRMNIASTLGNYFVSGTTSIKDGNMNFLFEVPWNVIGGVVASRVFGGKPVADQTIDGDIRKRYVKFYVVGTPENFDVKLRNKRDEKSGE